MLRGKIETCAVVVEPHFLSKITAFKILSGETISFFIAFAHESCELLRQAEFGQKDDKSKINQRDVLKYFFKITMSREFAEALKVLFQCPAALRRNASPF